MAKPIWWARTKRFFTTLWTGVEWVWQKKVAILVTIGVLAIAHCGYGLYRYTKNLPASSSGSNTAGSGSEQKTGEEKSEPATVTATPSPDGKIKLEITIQHQGQVTFAAAPLASSSTDQKKEEKREETQIERAVREGEEFRQAEYREALRLQGLSESTPPQQAPDKSSVGQPAPKVEPADPKKKKKEKEPQP